MEVDDLAPQLLRRPPLLRRLEVCRNVEFNQFRHHVLLAGNPAPFNGALVEPAQDPDPIQTHVSLFPRHASCFSKLCAADSRNTEGYESCWAGCANFATL